MFGKGAGLALESNLRLDRDTIAWDLYLATQQRQPQVSHILYALQNRPSTFNRLASELHCRVIYK